MAPCQGTCRGDARARPISPRTGYSSLKEQSVTAAESLPFNIAEGCGASTQKEFARYLDIGIKSACELESEFELAKDYGILRADDWESVAEKIVDTRRMLCGLRKKVIDSPDE